MPESIIKGIGSDIVEIDRIEHVIADHQDHFLKRVFTLKEQKYCNQFRSPAPHFAGRFAAKEAIAKALGTGFGAALSWLDIEILNDPLGQPQPFLSSQAQKRFCDPHLQITISHCKAYAVAFAIWS